MDMPSILFIETKNKTWLHEGVFLRNPNLLNDHAMKIELKHTSEMRLHWGKIKIHENSSC
jgi:hypothetical protein